MSFKINLIDDGLGTLFIAKGDVAAKEHYENVMNHLSRPDEEFKKILYTLVDYSQVDKIEMNFYYLSKIAKQIIGASRINSNMIVVHISSNSMVLGVAKVAGALAKLSGWRFKCYRNRDDAQKWISKIISEKYGDIELTFRE